MKIDSLLKFQNYSSRAEMDRQSYNHVTSKYTVEFYAHFPWNKATSFITQVSEISMYAWLNFHNLLTFDWTF